MRLGIGSAKRKNVCLSDILKIFFNFPFFLKDEIVDDKQKSYKPILKIDTILFRKMMIESVNQLKKNQEHLNRINVFPVQDGDTGSNMLHTMMGIKDSFEAHLGESFGTISRELVKAILLSARGNSGLLLSEYFKGFLEEVHNRRVLTGKEFVEALIRGSDNAWNALEKPQRGTILDIFSAAAEGAKAALENSNDVCQILDGALEHSRHSLMKTKEILPQMKRARVVDAGGAGFLCMLDGFRISLMGKSAILPQDFSSEPAEIKEEDLSFKYCVEAVLKGKAISKEELKHVINSLGDSILLVDEEDTLKLHIHTNEPQVIEGICRNRGQVVEWKMDDLKEMQTTYLRNVKAFRGNSNIVSLSSSMPNKSAHGRIVVVTDRSSDLPDRILQHPILVVDIPVNLSSDPVDLGKKRTLKEFYNMMATEKDFIPLTAQPNVEQFVEAYEKALEIGDIVLCLPISSGISGTYRNAIQAKRKLDSNKVHVIDSYSFSFGLTMLIEFIFDLQRCGKEYRDILIELFNMRDNMEQYFVVDDIRYLARSGRLSRSQSFLGQILHVNPLLQIKEGSIRETGERAFFSSPKKQMLMLARQVQRAMIERELKFLCIVHADAEERALMLKQYLEINMNMPKDFIKIAQFGMIIGAHVGPGTIEVVWA